ncbi:MAG: hypothetical protein MMC23_007687 [Stictis urceolatum]|nr:hypothetical protein [Stictis urceolata]
MKLSYECNCPFADKQDSLIYCPKHAKPLFLSDLRKQRVEMEKNLESWEEHECLQDDALLEKHLSALAPKFEAVHGRGTPDDDDPTTEMQRKYIDLDDYRFARRSVKDILDELRIARVELFEAFSECATNMTVQYA